MSQDDETNKDAAFQPFYRGLTQPRLSRQNFLLGSGAALLAALAPQMAHAEKVKNWTAWWEKQKPTKEFLFANWPYYIDVTSNGQDHPSRQGLI